ncbi:MAG: hypothetical protein H6719_36950 [Sandaracinaceae bacterium]|nr:hypothetical protein [Sandaracinaceae bacterium]
MSEEDALRQAAEELEIDPAYLPELRDMLRTDRSSWRACCGMLCTPCVLDLGRAIDRTRSLIAAEG